jgi:hypothetical protein
MVYDEAAYHEKQMHTGPAEVQAEEGLSGESVFRVFQGIPYGEVKQQDHDNGRTTQKVQPEYAVSRAGRRWNSSIFFIIACLRQFQHLNKGHYCNLKKSYP